MDSDVNAKSIVSKRDYHKLVHKDLISNSSASLRVDIKHSSDLKK